MDPGTLSVASSVIAAAPELYKLGTGIGQTTKAKRLAKYDRPIYDVPQSFDEALGLTRTQAASPYLPGQELIEDRLRGVTGRGVEAVTQVAQDPASAVAAVGSIYADEMQGVRDIGVAAAEDFRGRQRDLATMLTQRGRYEDKKFDINKMQLFEDAMAAARRLSETGQQNIFSGMSGLSEIAQSSMGGGGDQGPQTPLDDIFGGTTEKGSQGTVGAGSAAAFDFEPMAGKSLFEMKQSIGN